jgi:hypothetical protein
MDVEEEDVLIFGTMKIALPFFSVCMLVATGIMWFGVSY